MKQNPATKQIPVVGLSNLGQESDVQQALQGGAIAYLIKVNLSLPEAQGVPAKGDDPLAGLRLFRGKGCPHCHGCGFRGRLGVFELFEVNDHIRSIIMERQDTSAIRAEAVARGMKTMFQDGVAKAFFGETTLEEVFRVAV